MTDEKKQELFPYFAYTYSKQINPEKYGNLSSEEWSSLIQENPEDIDQISQAAGQLADEDWDALDQQFSQEQPQEQQAQYAAKGAKLKKLKSMKCGCGCNMVTVKEDGGKMSSKCACNCGGKMKHQKGGLITNNKNSEQMKENLGSIQGILDSFKNGGNLKKQNGGDLSPKAMEAKKKGGKAPERIKTEAKPEFVPGKKLVKKQTGGKTPAPSIYTAASATSKLPKMNAQSGANSATEKPKVTKKEKGGSVKPSINTAASATSKLPKMNAQSGANTSTVPTNPDGSMKTKDRVKKGQAGLKTPKTVIPPKKSVLPKVNGREVPDDGADYSVQGPANKSEKVKPKFKK